ncbi:MAG: hypothetical protein V2A58_00330 [Planctomycetota bacterium]
MKKTAIPFLVTILLPVILLAQEQKTASSRPGEIAESELLSDDQLMSRAVDLKDILDVKVSPAPDYPPCTDGNDSAQLFDGEIHSCRYDALSTVGWHRFASAPANIVTINLKLKQICFLTAVRLHVMGGRWAGVALPAKVWISASVDGIHYPLRLQYFPSPELTEKEQGLPFSGWLFLWKVFQLGRYVRLEIEMGDRGDILLLDEIQLLGEKTVYIYYRKDMALWAPMESVEEDLTAERSSLLEEGNLVINPHFLDSDGDATPDAVRVRSRDLVPPATPSVSIEKPDGGNVLALQRKTDEGVVLLVLPAFLAEAVPANLVFSVEVMTTGESACAVSLQGPAGLEIASADPTQAKDWKKIEIPVPSGEVVSRITFAFTGKLSDTLRVRGPRLAPAD